MPFYAVSKGGAHFPALIREGGGKNYAGGKLMSLMPILGAQEKESNGISGFSI